MTNDGFLQEPYKKYPHLGGARTFAAISETRALILLGEPGIGKTYAINVDRESIATDAVVHGDCILWPDLQEISTAESFESAIVNAPEFRAWLSGESVLHLYLDALDECMLRVQTLGRLLIKVLKRGPCDQLRLRLTCRTAEWSNELEMELKELIGGDHVKAFELLPLTRADVARALAANGIDETRFFSYVEMKCASALASRPVSLEFLMRCFLRDDLPSTQIDLYERGCLTLCEESEHRSETGLVRPLSAAERLAVAKRVAASTVFSTRSTLLFGRDDAAVSADALHLSEISGGEELVNGGRVDVTEGALRDALDTGLFTSRGARVLGWSSHTYEEYLAARYLSDSRLSPQQLLGLIVHPDDPDRKLTPQLHGVAAWLSVLKPAIFDYVVDHEPELLLLSDVVLDRPDDRARLLDKLLCRKRMRQLPQMRVEVYHKLGRLAHSRIGQQLRHMLLDRDEPSELREFVADIAEYTNCVDLIPELTEIALASDQPVDVRVDCAGAVTRIGNENQRAALKPLLEVRGRSRQDRWLVRLALKATWPCALSAAELFSFLSGKRRRLGYIADDYMLVEHILETLSSNHLGPALTWVLQRVKALPEGPTFKLGDALQRLEDEIIIRAWRSDDDDVTSMLARIAIEKIRRYEPLVSREDLQGGELSDQQLLNDEARRRRFASFLLPLVAAAKKPIPVWTLFEKTEYLKRDDLSWLFDRQRTGVRGKRNRTVEAAVLMSLADITVPSTFEEISAAARHNDELAHLIRDMCAPVQLDSEAARSAREWQIESQKRVQRRASRRSPEQQNQRVIDRVERWLTQVEQQPGAFWYLAEEMARETHDDHTNSMNLDIRTFPGWIAANDHVRRRILVVAERFVRECDSGADSWFGTQQFALSAMGGVRALMLLKDIANEQFQSLDGAIWTKWTPALLGIPNNDPNVPLLTYAYRYAPDEVTRRIQQLIEARDAYVVQKLSDVLDDALIAALITVARDTPMPDDTLIRLLEPLVAHPPARQFAESIVKRDHKGRKRERAVAVAALILRRAANESWETFWPLMTRNRAFGRAVIERAADKDPLDASFLYRLDEQRIADLYFWLTREYPPHRDRDHEGVYQPDTRDNVATWRSRCLDALKLRGTRAACEGLRRLAAQLPEQIWLLSLVAEAESIRRQKTWQPTSVAAFRQLLANPSRRQVRSETELLDVVVESLARLQRKLQDETPAAVDLWNTASHTPKSENECSDYVVRHLRDDLRQQGVIIAREVEIRPSASVRGGERTDIHVDVSVDIVGQVRTFAVIVEVKGCWNRGLKSDMTQQLARRYLRDNSTASGVFLVCCFHCDAWSNTDTRKRRRKCDRDSTMYTLDAEALRLRADAFDIRPVVLNCSLR